jgi:phosphomevalonate kinase
VALRAHRDLQGGKGSGVDIAAAVHGGLIEYEMQGAKVRRLEWPAGLRMRVIWTGIPSSTRERIDKLALQAPRSSRSALLLVAPRMAEAWASGDAQSILLEYLSYIGVLRQFSIDHELGIFDAGHEELTDAAVTDGLVYKPAGAGGGDIGVLFGMDDEHLDAFVARRRDLVHRVVPCTPDGRGVCLEQT